MKSLIKFCFLILICISCKHANTNQTVNQPSDNQQLMMALPVDSSLLDHFVRYRTFDEYQLRGIGKYVEGEYYAEVAQNDSCILVRIPYLLGSDSLICYRRKGHAWQNVIVRNWERKNEELAKCEFNNCASIYYRQIKNDTIIEYKYAVVGGSSVFKCIYLKTKNGCKEIRLLDHDIVNMSDPYLELDSLINQNCQYFVRSSEEEGISDAGRSASIWIKRIEDKRIIYSCKELNRRLVFLTEHFGEYEMQPGLEKYDAKLSKWY